MKNLSYMLALVLLSAASLSAAGSNCKKCEALKEYHKNHPSPYAYYEDYLNDLENKGADVEEDPDFPSEYFQITESEEKE